MLPMKKAIETHCCTWKLAKASAIPTCFQEKCTVDSSKITWTDMKSITLNNEKLAQHCNCTSLGTMPSCRCL